MNKNLNRIISKYHTDDNGNPRSIHIVRKHQISPIYNGIQLDDIPDESMRVSVIEPSDIYEVYNADDIVENSFYVRHDGVVLFHKSMAGKEVTIDYHGVGIEKIGADRVYTMVDAKGNIIETLGDVFEVGRIVIDAIKTIGDVIIVLEEIEVDIKEANRIQPILRSDIEMATPLEASLKRYVLEGQPLLEELSPIVTEGSRLDVDLRPVVQEGTRIEQELEDAIVRGDIPTMKADIINLDSQLSEIGKKKIIYSRNRHTGRILANRGAFKTVAVGDSICNGSGASEYAKIWVYQLQLKLQKINNNMTNDDFHVRNNGVGGQTIANIVNYISYDLNENKAPKKAYWNEYKNAIIMTGRNDWQSLSLEDFEYLYRLTVRQFKNNNIDVICCSEPPKLDMTSGNIVDGVEVVNGKTNNYYEYKEVIKRIAESEGVSFIDIWEELKYRKNSLGEDIRKYSSDGTHPNDLGHELIANLILECCKGISMPNNTKTDDFEEIERRFISQYIYEPYSTSNAELVDVSTVTSYTSRREHVGDSERKAWCIKPGGSIKFPISLIENNIILITAIMKLTTGKIQVQCPTGLNVDTRSIMTPFVAEHTYMLRIKNDNYPPTSSVVINAIDGDVYIQNITVITPYLSTKHSKVNCEKIGTWREEQFTGDLSSSFLRSSNIGDKLKIKWFGTNILFNVAKGLNNGRCKITTDGIELGTFDRYMSGNYYFDDKIGHIKPLSLGFHTTEIEILEKNSGSTNNFIGVKGVDIFTCKTSTNTFISYLGENIESYIGIENYNLIEGDNVKISNNVASSTSNTVMKLSSI